MQHPDVHDVTSGRKVGGPAGQALSRHDGFSGGAGRRL